MLALLYLLFPMSCGLLTVGVMATIEYVVERRQRRLKEAYPDHWLLPEPRKRRELPARFWYNDTDGLVDYWTNGVDTFYY